MINRGQTGLFVQLHVVLYLCAIAADTPFRSALMASSLLARQKSMGSSSLGGRIFAIERRPVDSPTSLSLVGGHHLPALILSGASGVLEDVSVRASEGTPWTCCIQWICLTSCPSKTSHYQKVQTALHSV